MFLENCPLPMRWVRCCQNEYCVQMWTLHANCSIQKLKQNIFMSAPYGLLTSCAGQEKSSCGRQKTIPWEEKGPPPTLNISGVRWGLKRFWTPTHPWTSYITKSCWSGGGWGSQKFWMPTCPLNILCHHVMLVRGWVGVQNISESKHWTMVHV